MQEIPSSGAGNATTSGTSRATGLLEDPHNVGILICNGARVARCRGVRIEKRDELLTARGSPCRVVWDLLEIEALILDTIPALKRAQGLSLQRLLDPCVLLFAEPCPPYDPLPGAKKVFLAIVHQADVKDLSPFELFSALLQKVKDHLPIHRSL
jgi:hypothetical protein